MSLIKNLESKQGSRFFYWIKSIVKQGMVSFRPPDQFF